MEAEQAGPGYDAGGGRSVRETVTADSQNQLLFALRKVRGDLDSRCDALEALQTEQVQKMKEVASQPRLSYTGPLLRTL